MFFLVIPLILLWLGITPGLPHEMTGVSQHPVPVDTFITLRRYDCFLGCPDYLVTISADGTVTFEGHVNVKVRGTVRSQISREKVQMLVTAFLKAKYFTLRNEYQWQKDGCSKVWIDSSSVTTSIRLNGKTKSIDHYLGCHRHGLTSYPKALSKLEKMIDEVANTDQWIN